MSSPITVIGIRTDKEQEDDLDRKQNTVEIEDHSGDWTLVSIDLSVARSEDCVDPAPDAPDSRVMSLPPQCTLPSGKFWYNRACWMIPP